MGNANIKEIEEMELGGRHLDRSSPKVITSSLVTHRNTRLRQKGNEWLMITKDDRDEDAKEVISLAFTMQKVGALFSKKDKVIRDEKQNIVAVLKTTDNKLKTEKTLVFRPYETFSGQSPTPEVYMDKKKKEDVPMYLFACIKTLGVSKCDASYSLLKVNDVYNDPDFATFMDPMYKASKINNLTKFASTITAGDDPSCLLGKLGHLHGRTVEAEVGDGTDILAVILLGLSVNHVGTSAGGLAGAGVV